VNGLGGYWHCGTLFPCPGQGCRQSGQDGGEDDRADLDLLVPENLQAWSTLSDTCGSEAADRIGA